MLLLQIDVSSANTIGPMIFAFFERFESISKGAELWLTVGKIIGSIGAYVYIFKKFGTKIMTGETFNLADIGYPIFIAFLLSVYTPVAKGIEQLFTSSYNATYISTTVNDIYGSINKNKQHSAPINDEMKREADASTSINDKDLSDAENYFKEANSIEEVSEHTGFTDMLLSGYQSVVDSINNVILTTLTVILECIIIACIAIIFFLAKLYITFLYIFGPFSIGMSLIPGFENSITNWFQKYIGYSLWMPVAATIADLTKEVLATLFDVGSAGNTLANPAAGVSALLITTAMLIVSMLAVPKLVSNIISTSIGSSSTASKAMVLMNMFNKSGGSVASAGLGSIGAGVATGGASIATTAATQALTSAGDNTKNAAEAPQRPS